MNALREYGRRLWAIHCNVARRITPHGFARIWEGIAAACLIGAFASAAPLGGLVLAIIGIGAIVMAWANETGRIKR